MTDTIRIVLVDDHPLVLEGICSRLNEEPNIEVVGYAHDGKAGLAVIEKQKPDVVLMDVSMPVMDGIEAMEHLKLKMPDVRVLILSMHDDQAVSYTHLTLPTILLV